MSKRQHKKYRKAVKLHLITPFCQIKTDVSEITKMGKTTIRQPRAWNRAQPKNMVE